MAPPKYRAFNHDNKQMYVVITLHFHDNGFGLVIGHRTLEQGYQISHIGNGTLCHFTGLTDIDGEEIYEYDVVETVPEDDSEPYRFEVRWDEDWCGYRLPEDYDEGTNYALSVFNLKRLGNALQNPALLRKGGPKLVKGDDE